MPSCAVLSAQQEMNSGTGLITGMATGCVVGGGGAAAGGAGAAAAPIAGAADIADAE
jgi:hypothetical protein